MVLNRFYPMIGGAETQCKVLSNNLIRNHNLNVDVVTYKYDPQLSDDETVDGININRLSQPRYGMLYFYVALFWYLIRNHSTYNVIHCHSISVTSFICCLAAKIFRKPCIIKHTVKNEVVNIYSAVGIKGFIKKLIMNFTLSNSMIITLTTEGEDELLSHNISNFRKIPNGVDKEILVKNVIKKPNLDKIKFGFLGRFCEQKGIDILLNAFENTNRNGITLELMGSSKHQDYSDIDNLLIDKKLILGERLIISPAENPPYRFYSDISVFVSASRYEGLPNTVLEAIALDKTCILSDIEPHRMLKQCNPNANIYLFNTIDELIFLLNTVSPNDNLNSLDDMFSITNTARVYAELYKKLS